MKFDKLKKFTSEHFMPEVIGLLRNGTSLQNKLYLFVSHERTGGTVLLGWSYSRDDLC